MSRDELDQNKSGSAEAVTEKEELRGDLSLLETIQSVLWAMLGVQKEKNARRDFRHASPAKIITVGILFGVVFVLTLVFLVNLILSQATVA